MLTDSMQSDYLAILREELLPATGCTEPIAIAYCAARLRALLGAAPERITATVSGNILKNVKSVVVPNTGGLRGLPAAIAAGILGGRPEAELQVIAEIPTELIPEIRRYIAETPVEIRCGSSPCMLDIALVGESCGHSASVRITNHHTNIVYLEKDGQVLLSLPIVASSEDHLTDKRCLNVADIIAFADTVSMERLRPVLEPQAQCNMAIAEEGIRNPWGAQIGRILLEEGRGDAVTEARAYAAAGSDARMSGCELPVVILSGSGNQGITASVPVICYARRLGVPEEKMYRALAVSDLITIHQKSGIGRLSAYCGAISAGVGAGAGVAYLHGGGERAIAHTVVNAVAILSGTICDGAKASCAAKIASAVDAGILGYRMFLHDQEFRSGEGIVGTCADRTFANVGTLAQEGMQQTDRTILQIMTES